MIYEGGQDRGKLNCTLKSFHTSKALSYATLVLLDKLASIKKFTCPPKGSAHIRKGNRKAERMRID